VGGENQLAGAPGQGEPRFVAAATGVGQQGVGMPVGVVELELAQQEVLASGHARQPVDQGHQALDRQRVAVIGYPVKRAVRAAPDLKGCHVTTRRETRPGSIVHQGDRRLRAPADGGPDILALRGRRVVGQ